MIKVIKTIVWTVGTFILGVLVGTYGFATLSIALEASKPGYVSKLYKRCGKTIREN